MAESNSRVKSEPKSSTETRQSPRRSDRRFAAIVAASMLVVGTGAILAVWVGRKNDVLSPEEQARAYKSAVAGMTIQQRYMGEFITGIDVCNPRDNNNFLEDIGVFTGVEACGRQGSTGYPETDEALGSTCLAGSAYDPRAANPASFKVDEQQLTVYPMGANQPELHFTGPGQFAPADEQTKQVLAAYSCDLTQAA